jgi:conjugative relaxase-like TrwC/TraI family protein
MMSISNLKSAAQAASYYEKDDYYTQDQSPSSWWGKTTEKLGLKGKVNREVFQGLLQGTLPDGTELPSSHGALRRPGIDLTFSAPKSVSLMALVGEDDRIPKAHREAVTAALGWLEETSARARTTEGRQTRTEATGNLLVARFEHDTSREHDPQLHTHAVVINVTKRQDGEYRAIDNEALYTNKMAAGAIYRAELAARLADLGYRIEVTHQDGRFEVEGISRNQVEAFSTRRKQIEEALGEMGFSSSKAAEVAALDSRKSKREVDRSELRKEWQVRAAEAGLELRIPERPSRSQARGSEGREGAAEKLVGVALEHFSERSSVLTRSEVVRFSLERGTGKATFGGVQKAIDQAIGKGELLPLGEGRFTTERALSLERSVLALESRGRGSVTPILPAPDARAILRDRSLKKGQKEAAETILSAPDRVVGVQGYAGTGKTFMLRTIRELAEAQGLDVRGFSTTSAAANLLTQDAGIPSETLARHLASGAVEKAQRGSRKPEVWVVDEASMMGTKEASDLLRKAEREGARVVLVGDRAQLPAIEAGKPFALLMDRGMTFAVMDEIVRQRDPDLKTAVELTIDGRTGDALRAIEKMVHQEESKEKRLSLLAGRYLESQAEPGDRPLLITGTNADRRALNDLVRVGLVDRGDLRGEGTRTEVLVPRALTRAERAEATTYQAGDVVRFGREYKSLGVQKGEYARVRDVDGDQGRVQLELAGGRKVDWEPDRLLKVEVYRQEARDLRPGDLIRWTRNDPEHLRRNGEMALVVEVDSGSGSSLIRTSEGKNQVLDLTQRGHWDHAYASTIYSAQGRTTDEVLIHLDSRQKSVVGQEAWYVAISRARESALVVTDDKDRLPEALKRVMGQKSAVEELERAGTLPDLERPRGEKDGGSDVSRPAGGRSPGGISISKVLGFD